MGRSRVREFIAYKALSQRNIAMNIRVLISDERTYEVPIDDQTVLRDFKLAIQDYTSISVNDQTLISLGKLIVTDPDFEFVKVQRNPYIQVCF